MITVIRYPRCTDYVLQIFLTRWIHIQITFQRGR